MFAPAEAGDKRDDEVFLAFRIRGWFGLNSDYFQVTDRIRGDPTTSRVVSKVRLKDRSEGLVADREPLSRGRLSELAGNVAMDV